MFGIYDNHINNLNNFAINSSVVYKILIFHYSVFINKNFQEFFMT